MKTTTHPETSLGPVLTLSRLATQLGVSVQTLYDLRSQGRGRLVHLPVHASWLNQIEIHLSILQRKAISPVDFVDLDHLAERILSFQDP